MWDGCWVPAEYSITGYSYFGQCRYTEAEALNLDTPATLPYPRILRAPGGYACYFRQLYREVEQHAASMHPEPDSCWLLCMKSRRTLDLWHVWNYYPELT